MPVRPTNSSPDYLAIQRCVLALTSRNVSYDDIGGNFGADYTVIAAIVNHEPLMTNPLKEYVLRHDSAEPEVRQLKSGWLSQAQAFPAQQLGYTQLVPPQQSIQGYGADARLMLPPHPASNMSALDFDSAAPGYDFSSLPLTEYKSGERRLQTKEGFPIDIAPSMSKQDKEDWHNANAADRNKVRTAISTRIRRAIKKEIKERNQLASSQRLDPGAEQGARGPTGEGAAMLPATQYPPPQPYSELSPGSNVSYRSDFSEDLGYAWGSEDADSRKRLPEGASYSDAKRDSGSDLSHYPTSYDDKRSELSGAAYSYSASAQRFAQEKGDSGRLGSDVSDVLPGDSRSNVGFTEDRVDQNVKDKNDLIKCVRDFQSSNSFMVQVAGEVGMDKWVKTYDEYMNSTARDAVALLQKAMKTNPKILQETKDSLEDENGRATIDHFESEWKEFNKKKQSKPPPPPSPPSQKTSRKSTARARRGRKSQDRTTGGLDPRQSSMDFGQHGTDDRGTDYGSGTAPRYSPAQDTEARYGGGEGASSADSHQPANVKHQNTIWEYTAGGEQAAPASVSHESSPEQTYDSSYRPYSEEPDTGQHDFIQMFQQSGENVIYSEDMQSLYAGPYSVPALSASRNTLVYSPQPQTNEPSMYPQLQQEPYPQHQEPVFFDRWQEYLERREGDASSAASPRDSEQQQPGRPPTPAAVQDAMVGGNSQRYYSGSSRRQRSSTHNRPTRRSRGGG